MNTVGRSTSPVGSVVRETVGLLRAWGLLTALFLFLMAGGFAAALLRFQDELPSTAHLEQIAPPSNTQILDRNGVLLGDLYSEDRLVVPLDQVPDTLVRAVLSSEDRRFHEHWGIEMASLARAALANVRTGRTAQGGSTITQQLARNLFLTHERTFTRKIKEALLTIRLERIYTKDEILAMYFNQIYYGNGAHGAKAAARKYFGVDLPELTLAQASLLAGIPANPSLYDPRRRFENAKHRQGVVLSMMVDHGSITADEAEAAKLEELTLAEGTEQAIRAPYFVERIRQTLLDRYGAKRMYSEGLKAETTLDADVQAIVEEAIETQLRRLEKINKYEVVRDSTWEAPDAALVQTPYVQAASVVLDTKTGEVLAMVGGRSFEESKFNRAVQALRQPGSSFKPFVYAAAVERGLGPSTIIVDEPLVVPLAGDRVYKPENNSRDFRGPITMRVAISKSVNVAAVRLLLSIGAESAIDVARRCGVRSPLRPYPSLALGAFEVNLLELTSAYTVFPNLGIQKRPWMIHEVQDRNGVTLEEGRATSTEALSAPVAAVVRSLLEEVMATGTGASAKWKGLAVPSGGKTGTTDEYTDAVFVGFTPTYTMGVWVGFDVKKSLGRDMSGSRAALPIWIDVMSELHSGTSPAPFEIPEGVTWRKVCAESGQRADPNCEETYSEIFVAGDEPRDVCPIHHEGRALDLWHDDLSFEVLDRQALEDTRGELEPEEP